MRAWVGQAMEQATVVALTLAVVGLGTAIVAAASMPVVFPFLVAAGVAATLRYGDG